MGTISCEAKHHHKTTFPPLTPSGRLNGSLQWSHYRALSLSEPPTSPVSQRVFTGFLHVLQGQPQGTTGSCNGESPVLFTARAKPQRCKYAPVGNVALRPRFSLQPLVTLLAVQTQKHGK